MLNKGRLKRADTRLRNARCARSCIKFNHISKDLSTDEKQKLFDLYFYYHKLAVCYKWKYKRIVLLANMSSIGLTSIGAIVGGVTLNPIVFGVLTGTGVMIKGYTSPSNVTNKAERCKFAYTNYEKVLTQIRSSLRGIPSDEKIFMSEVRFMDDVVTDSCPSIDSLSAKYESKYTAAFAALT